MAELSYTADSSRKNALRPSRLAVKRAALALAVALGIAGAGDFGYGYLTTGRYLQTTDDAYVKADSTIVSPKISGYLAEVLVGDNQPVKAGQLLARIDDRDFRTALDQAHADVAGSEAAVRNLDAQIALQQPLIEQGTADVAAAEANLQFAREEQARYEGLMKSGSGTVQRAQQSDAALRKKTHNCSTADPGCWPRRRRSTYSSPNGPRP
jgi:membrane fusion protein (multidrug efflux system)